jgi:hypothetical protein
MVGEAITELGQTRGGRQLNSDTSPEVVWNVQYGEWLNALYAWEATMWVYWYKRQTMTVNAHDSDSGGGVIQG